MDTSSGYTTQSGNCGIMSSTSNDTPPLLVQSDTYCLICGVLKNYPVVKQEIDTYEDQSSDKINLALHSKPWSPEERQLFCIFRTKFHITQIGSRWETDNEKFPFCGECQSKLALIGDLERKVEELKVAIKKTMIMSEKVFAANNVYDKDIWYYRVRMQVVTDIPKRKLMIPTVEKYKSRKKGTPKRKLKTISVKVDKNSKKDDEDESKEFGNATNPDNAIYNNNILPMDHDDKTGRRKSSRIGEKRLEESFLSSSLRMQNATGRLSAQSCGLNDESMDEGQDSGDDDNDRDCRLDGEDHTPGDENEASAIKDKEVVPGRTRSSSGRKIIVKCEESEDEDFVLPNDDVYSSSDDGEEIEYPELCDDFKEEQSKVKAAEVIYEEANKTCTYMDIQFHADGEFKYKCGDCWKVITSKNAVQLEKFLKKHVIKKHTVLFACKKCPYRGPDKRGLRLHIKVHSQNKKEVKVKVKKKFVRVKVTCQICGKVLIDKYDHKKHLWSHMSQEEKDDAKERGEVDPTDCKVQCDECGQEYSSSKSLRLHKRTHLPPEERPERPRIKELCTLCGGTFTRLATHMAQVHYITAKGPPTKFKCSECVMEFVGLSNLTKHKKRVHTEKTLVCTMCPRKFCSNTSLKNHMKGHLGIRDVQCPHCSSTFITNHAMKQHSNIYHSVGGKVPKRKPYVRGPTRLRENERKVDLVKSNTYCPPSYESWFKPKPNNVDDQELPHSTSTQCSSSGCV